VVEPVSAGVGGDVFVIAWVAKEKKLIALNASGRAPSGATPTHLAARGYKEHMAEHGIDSATVPGAVDGWDVLLKRAGTMTLKETLEPAATLAEQGFGITERIHNDWIYGETILANDPDSVKTYLVNGRAPQTYDLFRNPDLARTFRLLQTQGRDAFYKGEIAKAIVAKSHALGGTMILEDLANTRATWETPLSTSYHGYDVYEMPPSTQGFAALEMLNILEVCAPKLSLNLAALGPRSPAYWHLLVEAKKLAYADLYAYNGDPGFANVPVARLISKAYAAQLCSRIDPQKASAPKPMGDPVGGTVYLTVADRWGNMVSFIYSIYDTFGAGVTVPGYGFVLNDRGALFSLDPKSPNIIAPHKRPFHTLLPGFLMKDGQPVMAFGLMGGSQQAQGHVQVLIDMIDLGANPQAASDAARFTHAQASNELYLESTLYDLVGARLKAMGHDVKSANGDDMGGFQAIWFNPKGTQSPAAGADQPISGLYRGASDHRKDGEAVGW
jgi:gamma-glutamyltranspeptidase/glutathione hydrolase